MMQRLHNNNYKMHLDLLKGLGIEKKSIHSIDFSQVPSMNKFAVPGSKRREEQGLHICLAGTQIIS